MYIEEAETKMKKAIENMEARFTNVRAGRANPAMLNGINVMYYGASTPLNTVANITVPEARQLFIKPFDKSLVKEIEKAILVSDIGITPTNDGKAIRLNFPDLTEERRKELAKDVKKRGEEAKVAVRNIRRDANDFVKKQNKAGDLNEDQAKDEEDKVQKMTDKYIKQIDEAVEAKSKEIMTV